MPTEEHINACCRIYMWVLEKVWIVGIDTYTCKVYIYLHIFMCLYIHICLFMGSDMYVNVYIISN